MLYSIIEASPRRRRLISLRRLRLNPNYVDAHINLGTILSRQKRYAEAEPHLAMAARLRPDDAQAHYSLGNVLSGLCHYPTASAQFAEAMRLQPGDPNAYNATALIMAACPEPRFRDGKKAVGFATRACELTKWKDPLSLNALATAQAEAGEFVAAISSQKEAHRTSDGWAAESRLSLPAGALPGQEALPSAVSAPPPTEWPRVI